MIISEKQIMQLIHHCQTFQKVLLHTSEKITEEELLMYKIIEDFLGEISFQQSEELKVVE